MSQKKNKILFHAGFSIMLAILFSINASAMGSEDDGGNYIGPDGCKFCHPVNFNEWMLTNHSRAFKTLVEVGQEMNEECVPCHVTGYNKETKTYKFKDITCEECHSSGDISANIAQRVIKTIYSQENRSTEDIQNILAKMNLTKKSMVIDLTARMCGRCHQGEQHPSYEEWNRSGHARALVTVKNDKRAQDSCMKCQSVEWITAGEHKKPTLDQVTLGLTCEACHNVHDSNNGKMLRMPKNKLCESCHTMEGTNPGSAAFHPNSEMRQSIGGKDTGTYIYQPYVGCEDCHRYSRKYNESMKLDGITGHAFEIDFRACLKCHEDFSSAERAEKFVRNHQENVMEKYNRTLIKVNDAARYTDTISGPERDVYNRVLNESQFNMQFVEADGSKGEHNPRYAEELIHKAEIKADNILKGKPGAAVDIPGFDFLSGVMTILLTLLAIALKNRK
jgi:predicted CXXCH cytochrome family protein